MGQFSSLNSRIAKWRSNSIIRDGHWLYLGSKVRSGHALVKLNCKTMTISRASAIIFLGLDKNSHLQALHKATCPYPNCWNPKCLYVGSRQDNARDLMRTGNYIIFGRRR